MSLQLSLDERRELDLLDEQEYWQQIDQAKRRARKLFGRDVSSLDFGQEFEWEKTNEKEGANE